MQSCNRNYNAERKSNLAQISLVKNLNTLPYRPDALTGSLAIYGSEKNSFINVCINLAAVAQSV
jgi:hypothetical protein